MNNPLCSPLNLRDKLKPPPAWLEASVILDIALIAICFNLMDSRFLMAPGMEVDMPQATGWEAVATSEVLTLLQDDVILFRGARFSKGEFARYASRSENKGQGILLLKASKQTSAQILIDVISHARLMGYESVQIAAETISE